MPVHDAGERPVPSFADIGGLWAKFGFPAPARLVRTIGRNGVKSGFGQVRIAGYERGAYGHHDR